ncbi:hypothetical protein LN650_21500 [Klebsiella pneumoniae subsp. pneumoniae]|nr:hypothetical protein [Klebsiella pneumoniae subsp. pneumoniae]
MVKGTIWHAFYAKKIVGGLLLPLPALPLLIGIGIALLWFSRFQRTGKLCVSLGLAAADAAEPRSPWPTAC